MPSGPWSSGVSALEAFLSVFALWVDRHSSCEADRLATGVASDSSRNETGPWRENYHASKDPQERLGSHTIRIERACIPSKKTMSRFFRKTQEQLQIYLLIKRACSFNNLKRCSPCHEER